MTFSEYQHLVFADLYRITGRANWWLVLRYVCFDESYPFIFWLRTCRFTRCHWLYKFLFYAPARVKFYHLTYMLGISIHHFTEIGAGFFIGHFGGIIVSPHARIGKNCNISPGVVIGQTNRGPRQGYPILGDHIYIGPGAKIIGAVTIGNNVAIGANCVVTRDIPENSVVVGIPGRVTSHEGAIGYVNHTDYEGKIP